MARVKTREGALGKMREKRVFHSCHLILLMLLVLGCFCVVLLEDGLGFHWLSEVRHFSLDLVVGLEILGYVPVFGGYFW